MPINVKNDFGLSKEGIILPNERVRTDVMKQGGFQQPHMKAWSLGKQI